MHYICWLLISAIFFAIGEFQSKRWAMSPGYLTLGYMFTAYILGILAWLPAISQVNKLSIVGTLWSLLSMVVTVLLGTLYFKETLVLQQWVGVGFALVACVLLNL